LKIKGPYRPSLSCGVKGYARLVFDPLWLRPFKHLSAVGEISTDEHHTDTCTYVAGHMFKLTSPSANYCNVLPRVTENHLSRKKYIV
jgi:carboxypeptidase C (cathepsin A)